MGVKVAVVGGGSTYTPELVEGFVRRDDRLPVDELVLFDIDRERLDVVGALGLMSVAFNTAQVVGPAFAAVLIEWIGEGPVFILNGFAYSAVVLAAVAMAWPQSQPRSLQQPQQRQQPQGQQAQVPQPEQPLVGGSSQGTLYFPE